MAVRRQARLRRRTLRTAGVLLALGCAGGVWLDGWGLPSRLALSEVRTTRVSSEDVPAKATRSRKRQGKLNAPPSPAEFPTVWKAPPPLPPPSETAPPPKDYSQPVVVTLKQAPPSSFSPSQGDSLKLKADDLMDRARTAITQQRPEDALRLAAAAKQIEQTSHLVYAVGEERPSTLAEKLEKQLAPPPPPVTAANAAPRARVTSPTLRAAANQPMQTAQSPLPRLELPRDYSAEVSQRVELLPDPRDPFVTGHLRTLTPVPRATLAPARSQSSPPRIGSRAPEQSGIKIRPVAQAAEQTRDEPTISPASGNRPDDAEVTMPEVRVGEFRVIDSAHVVESRLRNPVQLSAVLEEDAALPTTLVAPEAVHNLQAPQETAAAPVLRSPSAAPDLAPPLLVAPPTVEAPVLTAPKPVPAPREVDDPFDEDRPAPAQTKGMNLSWPSLIGFLAGLVGLCGLGAWRVLERRHYKPRRVGQSSS